MGKYLTVNVNIDPGKIVQVIAQVAWVSEVPMSDRFRVGLRFEQFVQGNAEHISSYLHSEKI